MARTMSDHTTQREPAPDVQRTDAPANHHTVGPARQWLLQRLTGPWLPALLAGGLALVGLSGARAASVAPVAAQHGMVVSAQHLASQVGVDVLKSGGNAVDAAVAVAYTLAVVYPAAGNLGGGGFMTLQLADGRKTFIDFREKAPLAATANMYLDADGKVIPGLSTRGHLAVAVPGTVAGLEAVLQKYGSKPRASLMAPAIQFAENGFVLDAGDVEMLNSAQAKALASDAPSAAIFGPAAGLPGAASWLAGQRLVQKDLARTLRKIAREGAPGFYAGEVAQALVAANQAGKGILSSADLAQYQVRELAPVECDYRGLHVVSAPPPSSGGVVLCQILNVLEAYPLADMGYRSAAAVHVQIEAMRHAYLDRNTYLGDPDFVRNPVDRLLDKAYAARLRAAISPDRAGVSRELLPGRAPHDLPLPTAISAAGAATQVAMNLATNPAPADPVSRAQFDTRREPLHEGNNTTHFNVVDAAGNAVALTYTLNDWFGAKVTAAGTGVLLNNEMDDFTVKTGVPNTYGLVQGEANSIAPGKRPLSSMSPTIVTKGGQPLLVLGTPGGSRIITAILHTIVNVVDYGMTVQEAVDAPRFHQQWLPVATNVENFALSPDTRKILEGMGHKFGPAQPANHLAAILVGAPSLGGKPVENNRFYGANDPRRNSGLAAGY
jgi:gamma-glutamyltranspeptidase/glutathione hydrolase